MKRFIVIWILLSAGLNIWQMDRIRDLEEFEEDAKEIAGSLEILGNIYESPELLEEKK